MTDARALWAEPAWLATMTSWVDARLADAGIRRRGPLTEARTWRRAALLTFDSDRGRLWAKAVPPAFAHEVAVTLLLADIDPGIVPPVVAADAGLGRIITEHVPGPLLASLDGAPEVWAAAMSRLAEIQRVVSNERETLVEAGVVAAPLAELADRLPSLMADDDLLAVGGRGGLSQPEATALRERLPELAAACGALASSGIPDSLEHGDLTADEIIIADSGPVFLDWSDSSITHPFLSAASLLGEAGGGDVDQRAAAYLGPWLTGGFGLDLATGRELLGKARLIRPLHLAAIYHDRVLPGLDATSEVARVVPDALRAILRG